MMIYRDDKKYKDIENFKEYEVTSCIAYEMAIRNRIIQKSILEYLSIRGLIDYQFIDILFIDKSFVTTFNKNFNIKNKKDFLLKIHEIMLNKQFLLDITTLTNIDAEFLDFIYSSLKNKKDDDYSLFDCEDDDYENIQVDNLKEEEFKELKKNLIYLSVEEESTKTIYKNTSHFNVFSHDKTNNSSYNNIYQRFSKPQLYINPSQQQLINLMDININIPKHEIMSYIESIYDHYKKVKPLSLALIEDIQDEDNNSISLETELFWQENSFYQVFKIINTTKTNDIDEILNNPILENTNVRDTAIKNTIKGSEDWADCFFIYDYIKLSDLKVSRNEKIRQIIEILDYYYERPKYKRSAIIDRFKMMTIYIEKLNYKQLITG